MIHAQRIDGTKDQDQTEAGIQHAQHLHQGLQHRVPRRNGTGVIHGDRVGQHVHKNQDHQQRVNGRNGVAVQDIVFESSGQGSRAAGIKGQGQATHHNVGPANESAIKTKQDFQLARRVSTVVFGTPAQVESAPPKGTEKEPRTKNEHNESKKLG